MTGLDNQTQVRRKRTTVAGTGSLLVGIRRRHVVGQLAGALEHLTLVVRAVLVLDFFRHALDFIDGMRDTDQVAPGNAVKRVAGRTDLPVDLVAAANAAQTSLDYLREVRRADNPYLAWSKVSSKPLCDQG